MIFAAIVSGLLLATVGGNFAIRRASRPLPPVGGAQIIQFRKRVQK